VADTKTDGGNFETTPENVLMHLNNIYKDRELDKRATTKDFLAVRTEGSRKVKRTLKHYNLDVIISVGYRVNSKRAVQFRQWATRTLREHLTQGWTLSQQRFEANARELEAALILVQKAAHLLYFVIKNHPFTDGNKRSAAFLFVDFLNRNARLLNRQEAPVINDIGLAALTLLVAESDPSDKETMIKLIMNMLAQGEK